MVPDYSKVLQGLISSMQPLVVMDDSGTQLDVFKTYGNFAPYGMKISFVCFYWRALQFFIRWHAHIASTPNGLAEERTETLVIESFVYLTYISDVLKEHPSIYHA